MNYDIKPGTRSGAYQPGDILNFTPGKYDYFTLTNVSGAPGNPILFNFQAGVIFENGFDINDCTNLKFDGGASKNLFIQGATGVPLSFKGKCGNIEITGVKIDGAFSWLWFKTEVNEGAYANWNYWTKNQDGTISANYVMDGLKLSNFEFLNASFDGCYIDSTGQQADRPVTIDGVVYYPLPAKVANIQIQDGIMDGAARTGMQISGLLNGVNFLKNVSIKNCGKSQENYQGANFLIGGNSPAGIEIDGCIFDGAHLYNVRTSGGGIIKFTNNTCANATLTDGKQNSEQMASVEFDTYDSTPATLIIENNTIGASDNKVSVVVYGDSKSLVGKNTFKNNKCAGDFQNFTGVQFDTSVVVIPPPPPDTTIVSLQTDFTNKTATFNRADGTSTVFQNIDRAVCNISSKKWIVYFNNGQKAVQVK